MEEEMSNYTWTLKHGSREIEGQGSPETLIEQLKSTRLPGLTPADWIVDHLIADGLVNGSTVYRHDVTKQDEWQLTLRQLE
jgi:hypothetical protein